MGEKEPSRQGRCEENSSATPKEEGAGLGHPLYCGRLRNHHREQYCTVRQGQQSARCCVAAQEQTSILFSGERAAEAQLQQRGACKLLPWLDPKKQIKRKPLVDSSPYMLP